MYQPVIPLFQPYVQCQFICTKRTNSENVFTCVPHSFLVLSPVTSHFNRLD